MQITKFGGNVPERRHLFISHHHADDKMVDQFTGLLGGKDLDVRNSSIRAKPANQDRIRDGLVDEKVIRRLLRMKISWATTVVVLIGEETHSRPWVNWEIEEANAQGKRIVGVYERGGTNYEVPAALEKYSSSIVAWNAGSIQAAIDGGTSFQNPDGSSRGPSGAPPRSEC
jgi:hypothetical protein